jgi:hypothetical protein
MAHDGPRNAARGAAKPTVFARLMSPSGLSSLTNSPCAKGDWNDEGVTLVVCVVPSGCFDRFFAACAEEFKKGEPEIPLLVELAAEYGIEFQSGPPS